MCNSSLWGYVVRPKSAIRIAKEIVPEFPTDWLKKLSLTQFIKTMTNRNNQNKIKLVMAKIEHTKKLQIYFLMLKTVK